MGSQALKEAVPNQCTNPCSLHLPEGTGLNRELALIPPCPPTASAPPRPHHPDGEALGAHGFSSFAGPVSRS